ncbi:MAG: Carbamoyltransferase, partial [Candidatus Woesebacteria bacterium GW2011_GWB1_38_5]
SWFQGQMEVGPRALGNRSILANPTLLDMHKKVNEAKNRELWRPLAPSILDEKGESYMNGYFYSPFMLHTFQVKDSVKRKVPAIVHIDGSTRPQSVRKNINPGFYKLIKFYEKLSGIPLILNTSFNGAKEPIVCTPLDAISSFYTNSTDYLVLSNYLIKK